MNKTLTCARTIALITSIAFSSGSVLAQWKYQTVKDPMTDAVTTIAELESKTKLNLAFPYSGGTSAWLVIKHYGGNTEDDVSLSINRGQLLKDEGLTFRFDDGAPIFFTASGTTDGSSKVLFVFDPAPKVLKDGEWVRGKSVSESLSEAVKTKVKVTFYNEGSHIFEFATKGLKWPPPSPAEVAQLKLEADKLAALRDAAAKHEEQVEEARVKKLQLLEAEKVERERLAAVEASIVGMVPSASSSEALIWFKSQEPTAISGRPSAAVLAIGCKDGRKPFATVGTTFQLAKAWAIGVSITDVRYNIDGEDSHWNWERFGASEAGPLSGQASFVERLTTAKTMKVSFEREGMSNREAVTFSIGDVQKSEQIKSLLTRCK